MVDESAAFHVEVATQGVRSDPDLGVEGEQTTRRATDGRRGTPARASASARTRERPRHPRLHPLPRARVLRGRVWRGQRRVGRAVVKVREARGVEDPAAGVAHGRVLPTMPAEVGTPRHDDLDRFRLHPAPVLWGRRRLRARRLRARRSGVRRVEGRGAAGRPDEPDAARDCAVGGQRVAEVLDFGADLRERGLFQVAWAPDSAAAARAATDHRGAACSADLAHSSDQMYAGARAPSVIHAAHGPMASSAHPTQPR